MKRLCEEMLGSHPCPQAVELLRHQTLWRLVLSSVLGLCHLQSERCCVVSVACQGQEPRMFAHPTEGWSSGSGSLVSPRGDVAAGRVRVVVLKG